MLIDEFCSAKNQKTIPPNWELDGLQRIGNVLWGGISETPLRGTNIGLTCSVTLSVVRAKGNLRSP
ncbi:MAG TPA: hypothetical protein DC058_03870 [Planctomycetaceae bacterium]|nr:hypothetical protein [Planctomycetaceae bacterium]